MQTQTLPDGIQSNILSKFTAIEDWQAVGPFCVDGRDGSVEYANSSAKKHLHVQALGGSLLIAVINYMSKGEEFANSFAEVKHKMKERGFGMGVHRGSHALNDASDCGFADNLQKIVLRLVTEDETIFKLIEDAAPSVVDTDVWRDVVASAKRVADKILPSGESIIKDAHLDGSNLQTLDGDHAELAAVVNLVEGTTLDTTALVAEGQQAFNLDLWYVLKQAEIFNLDTNFTILSSLGLYVATEMVLVEDKKQIRLPIVVRS